MSQIKGKYHKTLAKVFFCLSLAILFLLIIISGVFLNRYEAKQKESLTLSIDSSLVLAKTNLTVVLNELYNIQSNYDIWSWMITEPSDKNYRIRQLNAYRFISNHASKMNMTSYGFVMIPLDPRRGIISNDGTMTREWFLKTSPYFSEELANSVLDAFSKNCSIGIFRKTSEKNETKSIIIAIRAKYPSGDAVILAVIPEAYLIQDNSSLTTTILSPNFELISNASNEEIEILDLNKNELINAMKKNQDSITIKGINSPISIKYISLNDIAFLYYSSAEPLISFITIFMILLSLIICSVGLIGLTTFLTRKLYSPINEIMDAHGQDLLDHDENEATPDIDEFAVIDKMGSRLKEVTKELQTITSEQEKTPLLKSYRLLLAGTVSEEEKNDISYAIALLEVDESTENGYCYSLMTLQANTEKYENITWLTLTPSRGVLIISLEDEISKTNIMETILELTADFDSKDNVRISLSDIVNGKHNIYRAYRQCVRIMDCKHLYPATQILTTNDVNSTFVERNFYTTSTELSLINAVLKGNKEALDIFDNILEENKTVIELGENGYQQLFLLLESTYLKILQELRINEDKILGYNIDWVDLSCQWKDKTSIIKIREIIQKTIEWVQENEQAMDLELVSNMQAYIKKNYKYDIMLVDLAKKFNISPNYASAIFKKQCNDNFKNYLNKFRIEQAKNTIEKNPHVKIQDLSIEVGFNSATNFIRVFNKYEGTSPKAYADMIARNQDEA